MTAWGLQSKQVCASPITAADESCSILSRRSGGGRPGQRAGRRADGRRTIVASIVPRSTWHLSTDKPTTGWTMRRRSIKPGTGCIRRNSTAGAVQFSRQSNRRRPLAYGMSAEVNGPTSDAEDAVPPPARCCIMRVLMLCRRITKIKAFLRNLKS